MIFLRAIPFSLSILWRYAMVLPLLILAMIMFAIVAAIPMLILGFISPLIGFVLAMAFSVGLSVVPIMVGTRVGLQSYRVKPKNTYAGVLVASIGYGLFEALCLIVLFAAGLGVFMLLSSVSIPELLTSTGPDTSALMSELMDDNTTLGYAVFAVGGLLMAALRAALLVPFTAASVGNDPDGRKYTPFYGFGSRFGSMFSLVILSYILSFFAVPLAIMIATPFGLSEAMAETQAILDSYSELGIFGASNRFGPSLSYFDLPIFGVGGVVVVAAAFFISLFAFSLQCAGAVLVYMEHKGAYMMMRKEVESEMEEVREAPMQNTDMMELMRSRMPTRNE